AYLGFNKSFTKQLRLDNGGLVALANEYAASMGCPEPPVIDKSVVGKMGLRGTPGLNVGIVQSTPRNFGPRQGGGGGGGGQGKVVKNGVPGGAPNGGINGHGGGGAGSGGRGGRRPARGRGGAKQPA
ncbi:hypothetical protein LTR53_013561, partial [Teratosphaeriaceae sp. CCFEE 6253]